MAFDCEALLDFEDVEIADCRWVDATQLTASVSGSLGLLPGGNISLNAYVLKAACDDGYRCECRNYANTSFVTAEPPEEPLIPSAVRSSAPPCPAVSLPCARRVSTGAARTRAVFRLRGGRAQSDVGPIDGRRRASHDLLLERDGTARRGRGRERDGGGGGAGRARLGRDARWRDVFRNERGDGNGLPVRVYSCNHLHVPSHFFT